MRCAALIHSDEKAFLFSAGFVPRLNTYPGWNVPNPLDVEICNGEADIKTVLQDILRLSKLNYNSCKFADAYPITLKFAGKVGDILTTLPPEEDKSSEGEISRIQVIQKTAAMADRRRIISSTEMQCFIRDHCTSRLHRGAQGAQLLQASPPARFRPYCPAPTICWPFSAGRRLKPGAGAVRISAPCHPPIIILPLLTDALRGAPFACGATTPYPLPNCAAAAHPRCTRSFPRNSAFDLAAPRKQSPLALSSCRSPHHHPTHLSTAQTSPPHIPRSRHNPKILGRYDAEIVGDRITQIGPVPGNRFP